MIWHRSFHELIGNDAAWELLGVTKDDAMPFLMEPAGSEDTSMNWA